MPFSHDGQARTHRENLVLAFALASVAGAVNAIGFLELGVFTSNMSGSVTTIGLSLVRGDELAGRFARILLSFVAGAMTATLLVERARMQRRARYVAALMFEIVLLSAVALVTELVDVRARGLAGVMMSALAFSMGLQNALVTKISGAVVRTTHLTGIVTDFSIELVRLLLLIHERARFGSSMLEHVRQATRLARDQEFYRARLHLTIFLSFLSGGALGTAVLLHFGRVAMVLPVTVLIALVAYDRFVAMTTVHEDGPLAQHERPALAGVKAGVEPPRGSEQPRA